jgi:hypothetical protein
MVWAGLVGDDRRDKPGIGQLRRFLEKFVV